MPVRKKKAVKPKEKVIHVSGKRKRAIARATIKKGTGLVRINSKNLDTMKPDLVKLMIKEPLMLSNDLFKNMNFNINVKGGGMMGQAEAARLVIAKGIVEFTRNNELKRKFLDYDRHLLVADVRRTEPQKPCRSSARE